MMTVSRIRHLPRRRSRQPIGPHSAYTTVRRAHRCRCMHARTHSRTYNVTKRDGELRMRTTEKCNTESPAAWRVVTHRSHTHAQNRRLRSRVLLTTITLRPLPRPAVEWTRNNIHSTTITTNIHDDDNRLLKINAK